MIRAAAVVFLLSLIGASPVLAKPDCGALNATLEPPPSGQMHRVSVVFSNFHAKRVTVDIDEDRVLDQSLRADPEDSTEFSGLFQCLLEGQHSFIFSVDGQGASLTLDIREGAIIYFSPGPMFSVRSEDDPAGLD